MTNIETLSTENFFGPNFVTMRFSTLQVKNNIVRVFSKFIEQGKITIKFKDPSHDLCISKVNLWYALKYLPYFSIL